MGQVKVVYNSGGHQIPSGTVVDIRKNMHAWREYIVVYMGEHLVVPYEDVILQEQMTIFDILDEDN